MSYYRTEARWAGSGLRLTGGQAEFRGVWPPRGYVLPLGDRATPAGLQKELEMAELASPAFIANTARTHDHVWGYGQEHECILLRVHRSDAAHPQAGSLGLIGEYFVRPDDAVPELMAQLASTGKIHPREADQYRLVAGPGVLQAPG